jgi:glucans biosynthesis protein
MARRLLRISMLQFNRRRLIATTMGLAVPAAGLAQGRPAQQEAGMKATEPPRFSFDEVVKRARQLAGAPYDATPARLPETLEQLDFDAWRDIRFKPEKAIPIGQFRLHVFHLGHLFKRSVTINTIREGVATPLPYSAAMFDYGRTKFERNLPVNTGFAGFRLHFPVNDPRVWDEICSFVGASYFRFLGRGQQYGLSARALAVNTGTNAEEFPHFREFWIELTDGRSDRITIYGLLDGASVTGAYRFDLIPGQDAAMEARATLFVRRPGVKLGLAPLTSMFFLGENDRRANEDFRTELHDSDGLQLETSSGEWLWRPLRNPHVMQVVHFMDVNPRGFGLMQRDRDFATYQDLDLNYQARPSYWVEPRGGWGEGAVELVELPTTDETNDNIVASFTPKTTPEPGQAFNYGYRLTALLNQPRLSPNGRATNTFQTVARALGSRETPPAGARRFLIDFSGGDLPYYAQDAASAEVVASISRGKILRAFLLANPHNQGLRAVVDVTAEPGETGDIRVFLRAGGRALTETWTFPWTGK